MNVRIRFLGAAGSVTGSKYLLEINDYKLLVDCGLFQGLKDLRLRNWDEFPLAPAEIDEVVLTHAHIDHSGYLPRLFKQGFEGPVHCTSATLDLVKILLLDSAKLQVEEAEYAARKGYSKHPHPKALYDLKDVDKVLPRLNGYMFDETINLTDEVSITFRNASHILGAAIVEVNINGENQDKKIVFSGDIGRYYNPILYPPYQVKHADILLIESTYGTRNNPFVDPKEELASIINKTFEAGGCVLIPAFAVGRTQSILFYLKELMDSKMIDEVPIYMDSPMAITTTGIYQNHFEFHKLDEDQLKYEESFVGLRKNLHLITQQGDSVALNKINSRAIIISASGMLNGGRILHHLYNRLPRSNDTLMLVGYQAEGTRGRRIVDGELHVRIFGENVPVRCRVEQVDGLSAHADKSELHTWLSGFEDSPKMTFVVHGERESTHGFARNIRETYGWNAMAPEYLESAELFRGI